MPKLSAEVWSDRRRHVLTSAWGCFSRNGFHATSMDDVIAATGWSSSAVYRYVRGKDELIEAAAEESLRQFEGVVTELLARTPRPSPEATVRAFAEALGDRARHPDFDLTRIVVQSWSEALRNPLIEARARLYYDGVRRELTRLTTAWSDEGRIGGVDPEDAAAALVLLVPGLVLDASVLGGTATPGLIRALATIV